jgi:copper(I)-binding protein
MKIQLKIINALVLLLTTLSVQAEVTINDAWIRATVPQQMATGAFFQIKSTTDARVVSVQTAAAGVAEIHEMKMENNVMKMRAIEHLELAAGKMVELKPGGYHLMLMDIKKQIKAGDVIPLTLVVEGKDKKRESIEIQLKARSLNAVENKM